MGSRPLLHSAVLRLFFWLTRLPVLPVESAQCVPGASHSFAKGGCAGRGC